MLLNPENGADIDAGFVGHHVILKRGELRTFPYAVFLALKNRYPFLHEVRDRPVGSPDTLPPSGVVKTMTIEERKAKIQKMLEAGLVDEAEELANALPMPVEAKNPTLEAPIVPVIVPEAPIEPTKAPEGGSDDENLSDLVMHHKITQEDIDANGGEDLVLGEVIGLPLPADKKVARALVREQLLDLEIEHNGRLGFEPLLEILNEAVGPIGGSDDEKTGDETVTA